MKIPLHTVIYVDDDKHLELYGLDLNQSHLVSEAGYTLVGSVFPAVSSYTPATTFETVAGVWLYSWDNTDKMVNADGTGGSAPEGTQFGRLNDRSGYSNYVSQATLTKQPVNRDGATSFFRHAPAGPWILANMSNVALNTTFQRNNFSGGIIIDAQGSAEYNVIFSLGDDDFDLITGDVGTSDPRFFQLFVSGTGIVPTTAPYSARKHVLTWRSNTTNLIFNVDGVDYVRPPLTAQTMSKLFLSVFGPLVAAEHSGVQRELVLFADDVGVTEIAQLREYLNEQANTAAIDPTKTVVIFGDSLCRGWGSETGKAWSEYITNRSTSKWFNYAEDGIGILAPSLSAAQLLERKGSTEGVAIIWIGINDAGSPAATVHTALANYCGVLKAGGMKVLVCTLPDITGSPAFITSYNSLINANYATYADGVIDLYSAVPIGGIHLNDARYIMSAAAIQAAMDALP